MKIATCLAVATAFLLLSFAAPAQNVTYKSESLENYRGKSITLRGTAYPISSNFLTRFISGCGILVDTTNGSFAVRIGSPRTTWAKLYIPCDIYQPSNRRGNRISITGTLETWYPGKFVRGANVVPMYFQLDSIRVTEQQ